MEDITIGNDVTMPAGATDALAVIDQFEIVRKLGGGGFGSVYLARDTVAGVEVAVKGLPPVVRNNTEELERIRANFALVSRLHHPYIAAALHLHRVQLADYRVNGVYEELNVGPYDTLMVMEYAPGVTLSQWRRQFPGGIVPLDKAVAIVRQLAEALDYAHSKHILHRDIKPSNIMIETSPEGEVTSRLLDFGLAAEIKSSMGRVSREIHDVSGTRPYMAPEQWAGEKQGLATDQYALAVVFCELVTGEVPFASVFECGDPVIMMTTVCNREAMLPSECPFRGALLKALAKRPDARFDSCADFVSRLNRTAVTPTVSKNPVAQSRRGVARMGRTCNGFAQERLKRDNIHPKDYRTPSSYGERDRTDKNPIGLKLTLALVVLMIIVGVGAMIAHKRLLAPRPVASVPEVLDQTRDEDAAIHAKTDAEMSIARIRNISRHEGLQQKFDQVVEGKKLADNYYQRSVFAKAMSEYRHVIQVCETICKLNDERTLAQKNREIALSQKAGAEKCESQKYAAAEWTRAEKEFEAAQKRYDSGDFLSATKGWTVSADGYREACRMAEIEVLAEWNKKRKLEADRTRRAAENAQLKQEGASAKVLPPRAEVKSSQEDGRVLLVNIRAYIIENGQRKYMRALVDPNAVKAIGLEVIKSGFAEGSLLRAYKRPQRSVTVQVAYPQYSAQVQLPPESFVPADNEDEAGLVEVELKRVGVGKDVYSAIGAMLESTNPSSQKTFMLPNDIPIEMVWCGPGTFSSVRGRATIDYEMPGFWIARYELTQRQWMSVMNTNPSEFTNGVLPVENLSWNDAARFVTRLNARTGRHFRLPSSCEWEYAARGGPKGEMEMSPDECAWWGRNSGGRTHQGGGKQPNALGLYDVLGNVWEWCMDVGTGENSGKRELRGGSFCNNNPKWISTTARMFSEQDCAGRGAGLRIVCDSL